jgi:hypothetical protein
MRRIVASTNFQRLSAFGGTGRVGSIAAGTLPSFLVGDLRIVFANLANAKSVEAPFVKNCDTAHRVVVS